MPSSLNFFSSSSAIKISSLSTAGLFTTLAASSQLLPLEPFEVLALVELSLALAALLHFPTSLEFFEPRGLVLHCFSQVIFPHCT